MTASLAMQVERQRSSLTNGLESLIDLVRRDTTERVTLAAKERTAAEDVIIDAAYVLRALQQSGSSNEQMCATCALLMAVGELPAERIKSTVVSAGEAPGGVPGEKEGLEPHVSHRVDTGPAAITKAPPALDWEKAERHIRKCDRVYSEIPQGGFALIAVIRPLLFRLTRGERTAELHQEIMEVSL